FLSPFWRGPERVVTERIAPPVKPLITADPGSPVNRWDDPGFENTVDYEPWTVVEDRKSTRLNSSHVSISYAVFCLKKKNIVKQHHSKGFREETHKKFTCINII